MKTNEIREMLSKATARPWVWAHIFDGENVIQGHRADHVAITEISADAALIVALVNNAEALLAENERLREGLIFIRDKEQAALEEFERSFHCNIPKDAGCMEILHAAHAALEERL